MTAEEPPAVDRQDDGAHNGRGFLLPPRSLKTRLVMLVAGGVCILVGIVAVMLGPFFDPPVRPWYLISAFGVCLLALGMGLMWKPMATRKHANLAFLVGLGVVLIALAWYRSNLMLRDVERRERRSQEHSQWTPLYDRAMELAAEAALAETTGDAAKAAELYRKAADEYRRALADAERRFGPESGMAACCLAPLASVEAKRGKPEEADALYQRALAVCRKTGDNPGLRSVVRQYAGFLRELGREDEARQVEAKHRLGAPARESPEPKQ